MLDRLRVAIALVVLVGVLTIGSRTQAQATLLNGLGGPAGYGTNRVPANDDDYSGPVSLTSAFPMGLRFFGGPYTEVYVNNNGCISFNAGIGQYTPDPFPIADQPMIAPYWGDVDTRGVWTDNDNAVYWHFSPGRMVVTWLNVGYYDTHDDKRMSFQMILTNALDCGSGDFDVEFRYNRCEWTTGDASDGVNGFGGTPAQAGFDAGNGTDFVEIPGSRTMSILDLCTTSNVGIPGVWRFAVRGGEVSCPGNGMPCQGAAEGACGFGITQCVGREVVCTVVGQMSEERCDGIDNDCDGTVDDGPLCDAPNVCSNGQCVPPCFEGGCMTGFTCTAEGGCVDTACMGVTCPPGARCSLGECLTACDGIVCPYQQQCFMGRCIDICNVLTCGADEVCFEGRCVPTCPCRPCAADETCSGTGECTPNGCDLTICDEGFYCRGGTCHDACAGAVCPPGQGCVRGQCVDGADPGPGPGEDGGGSYIPGGRGRGCCQAAGSSGSPLGVGVSLALLALALLRRRRT